MITLDLPESITRERYQALLHELGFETLFNLMDLEFHRDGIHATVIARDENGRAIADNLTNELITHRVFIPVVDR